MLLALLVSLFSLAKTHSAAITTSPHLVRETNLAPPSPQNLSALAFVIPSSLNNSVTPINIDPRLTYDKQFTGQFLNKDSAYMNTLLALADLSTKGWTSILRWEAQYSFFSYGDVVIRIHASMTPSNLQYRYAIWGLYRAIHESSANGFRACVLTLYWSLRMGWTPHIIGYVSILRGSLPGIGSGNSTTKESRELTLPMQISPPAVALSNFTTTLNDSSALADRIPLTTNSYVDITLLGKPLAIDAIFDVIYAGMLYLSAWPQIQAIDKPGFIKDDVSRTILRWDSSHLTVYPSFEYKYAIAALVKLPACMYELNRFEDARFIVYVNEIEVGRGWLYRTGVGESM